MWLHLKFKKRAFEFLKSEEKLRNDLCMLLYKFFARSRGFRLFLLGSMVDPIFMQKVTTIILLENGTLTEASKKETSLAKI